MTEKHIPMNEFDRQALAATLKSESNSVHDIAHGDGEAVGVAEGKATLEVYPSSGVARITTPDARIELFRVPGFTVDPEAGRVVFELGREDDRTRLVVGDAGDVHLYPLRKAVEPRVRPGQGPTTPVEQAATEPTPEAATEPQKPDEEQKEAASVTLQGRLGRDPWFSGSGDQPMAGFPLAVNGEQGKTTWHKVVVFDAVAEKLNNQSKTREITKGRPVAVTGQHVTREEQTSRGIKKSQEFHATEVTRLRPTSRPTNGQQH